MNTAARKLHNKWLKQFKPALAHWYADEPLLEEYRKLLRELGQKLGYTEVVNSVLQANSRLVSVITGMYLGKKLPEYPPREDLPESETIALLLYSLEHEMSVDNLVDDLGDKLEFRNDLNVILSMLNFSSYSLIRSMLDELD